MRLGICTGLDHLVEAYEAGYAYAETQLAYTIGVADVQEYAQMRQMIEASPIPVEVFNCLLPGEIKVVGPDADLAAADAYLQTALPRAAEVGADMVVFGSGGSRALPDGFPVEHAWEQLADAARLAGDIAGRCGLTIVMEPLCGCRYLNRVDIGAEFVDRLNHPQVKLLADLFHMAKVHEPFDHLSLAGNCLAHIHVATPAIPEVGEGEAFDFTGFFTALAVAGYDGRVSVEDNPWLLPKQQPPWTTVFRAMREYVESCRPVRS